MDDVCAYTMADQISETPEQKDRLLHQCYDANNMVIEMPDIEDALKDQKTVLIDAEFENFLRLNSDFWYEIKQMFSAWNNSAEVFSKK